MALIRPYDRLLDARTGWQAAEVRGVEANERLTLRPTQARRLPVADPSGTLGEHILPRGIVVWQDEVYIADPPRHRLLRWRPCCGPAAPLPSIGGQGSGPRQLDTPLGLALSPVGDLVVADTGNHRLLLFTLPGLALRRIIGPYPSRYDASPVASAPASTPANPCVLVAPPPAPRRQPWRPVDVASGPGGRLYVADADGSVWRLDLQGRPDPHYPGRLPSGARPLRLAVDADGRAYVVAEGVDEVLILDQYGQPIPGPAELEAAVEEWLVQHPSASRAKPPTFDEEAEARVALLPPGLSRQIDTWLRRSLIAAVSAVTQPPSLDDLWASQRHTMYSTHIPRAYAELLPLFLAEVLPASRLVAQGDRVALMPRGRGACHASPQLTDLTLDETGRLQLVDSLGADAPYLVRRLPAAQFERTGFFRTQALDSGRMGARWHRVVVELDAPERTEARLFSFTSDVPQPDLTAAHLVEEPLQPYPWQAAPAAAPQRTYEWLVQSPPGRYLYLALALKGPGDATPAVTRIYVYARRESSLNYLPATYLADEASRDFLDRFLSLTDTIFGEIESDIEDFPFKLDVRGAPADFLPWLASWFDLHLEAGWNEATRRAFLKNVVELYRRRGTLRGIQLLVRLHLGLGEEQPYVIEHFRGYGFPALMTWLRRSADGDAAHHFTVVVPGDAVDTEAKRATLNRLIAAYAPAHTHFSLRPIYPGARLGSDTMCGAALGVDSALGDYSVWRLPKDGEQDGILGARTVLPSPPIPIGALRLGVSRLGVRAGSPSQES